MDAGLVERFLQRLATERGCSPRTVQGYRADLSILARLARPAEPISSSGSASSQPAASEPAWTQLTQHDLRRWIASEARAGRSPRSTARRLSAWRGFYDWLAMQGGAEANPARGVRAPRAPRRLPKALSPDQAARLMTDVSEQAGSMNGRGTRDTAFEALRDVAMLELLYSSGLRLSELTSLDVRYFEAREATGGDGTCSAPSAGWYLGEESEVTVTGKGGRRRSVPVGSYACAALAQWMLARAAWLDTHPHADPRPLFLASSGRRLANRTVQVRLKRLAIARGIPANVHPHVLRHSFASHLLQSSGDLRAVQELLGHASIATTQIYTSLDFQRLAAVYDAAHPRARRRD